MAFPSLIEKFLKLSRDVANAVTVSGQAKTTANEAKESAATKAPANHKSTATTYGVGDKTNYGHVKLLNATNSTLGEADGTAATPSSVKSAYDLANTANTTANTAKNTANAAMPKAGGTFSGNITMPGASGSFILDVSGTATALGNSYDLPMYIKQKATTGDVYGAYPFFLVPTASSGNYGIGFGMQTGGALVLGAGESAKEYANANKLDGGTESIFLTTDNHIYFISNLQNGNANGKVMSYSNAGNLTLPANGVVTATSFKGLATNATNDAKGQAITTYVRGIAVSGSNIVVTNGAGTASNVALKDITGNAATATQLKTSRTFKTNLESTSAASFNGTAACAPGVSGILPVANGGTGNKTGTAAKVTAVPNIKVFQVNVGKSWTAPSGGTWAYFICGSWNAQNIYGTLAGGKSVAWPNSGHEAQGIAIRIA